jgi:hypothetical protein
VNAIDPAAAPLGTDEEAAGTPIDPKLLAVVRRRERRPRDHNREDWTGVFMWVVIVAGLAIGVAAGLILAA